MKKLLSIMLTVAMILTVVAIPASVSATEASAVAETGTVYVDYFEGDTIKQTFDADNAEDIAKLVAIDGSAIQTATFGGETYAYTTADYFNIPQISPAVPSKEPIYIKLRLHARSTAATGNGLYIYTTTSGGKRGAQTITDKEMGTTGMVSADANAAGVDVIFKFNQNTEDGFGIYVRKADSDGAWTTVNEAKAYAISNNQTALQLYNNLAISSAVVYTKQAPAVEAVNRAADASEMAAALATYATELGVDLTKLDAVLNDNSVYARLIDTSFSTAAEVVAAFDAAVAAQKGAEFASDYVEGDTVKYSFDADKAEDVATLSSSDGSAVETKVLGGETYAYTTSTANGWLDIPYAPGVPSKGSVYVKFRLHALSSATTNSAVFIYTLTSGGRRAVLTVTDKEMGTTGMVSGDADGAGLDLIFKLNYETGDSYDIYVRRTDSDGEWTTAATAKAYGTSNVYKTLQVQSNMSVSDVVVYTKQAAELDAVNRAANASEMATALTTYATALGVDLTKLDIVENDDAVYASLLDTVFYSTAEVVAAFDAAVEAQFMAEFDADFVEGDVVKQSFDASNSTDVAGITTDEGSSIVTETFGGEAYVHADTGFMYMPISPSVPSEEPVYVKLRIHATKIEKYGAGTGLNVYTTNSGGKLVAEYINDGDMGTSGLISADADSPGMDIIFKFNPDEADGYDFYMREAGSDDAWTVVRSGKAYGNNTYFKNLRVGYNIAVSNVKVYTKTFATLEKIGETAEKVSFKVTTSVKLPALSKVYVAAFDENDALIGAAVETYVTKDNTTVEVDIPSGTAEYFKAFIWDHSANPLVGAVTLNN